MLEMYEKRRVLRMLQNKVVELKQSPLEVLQNPVGVAASSIQESSCIAIRCLYNKVQELDELLRKILSHAERQQGETVDGTENG